jgi:hypothetical protein
MTNKEATQDRPKPTKLELHLVCVQGDNLRGQIANTG